MTESDRRGLNSAPTRKLTISPRYDPHTDAQACELGPITVFVPKSSFHSTVETAAGTVSGKRYVFESAGVLVALCESAYNGQFMQGAPEFVRGQEDPFEFVKEVYGTRIAGLERCGEQESFKRAAALLTLKAVMAPVGCDHRFEEFECGGLKGFISGDPDKDERVLVEVYVQPTRSFFTMVISRKTAPFEPPAIYDLIGGIQASAR